MARIAQIAVSLRKSPAGDDCITALTATGEIWTLDWDVAAARMVWRQVELPDELLAEEPTSLPTGTTA